MRTEVRGSSVASPSLFSRDWFGLSAWRAGARTSPRMLALSAVLVVAVGYFVVYPIFLLGWVSLRTPAGGGASLSLRAYAELFADPVFRRAALNSFYVGLGTTVTAGSMGVGLAWIVARTNTPLRATLDTLNLIPFFLSPFIGAISWRLLASPKNGLLNQLLMRVFGLQAAPLDIYSLPGIIWVLTIFYVPYVYLFTVGSLKRMDPSLEEAGRVCGATPLRTVRKVTLPLSAPAIMAGLMFVFVTSAGIIDVPLLLGDPVQIFTLPTRIYAGVNWYPPRYDLAAAIAAILLLVAIIGTVGQHAYVARRSFVTQSGRGGLPTLMDLGWGRYVTLALNLLYLILCVVLPLLVLVLASLSPFWSGTFDPAAVTMRHYRYVLTEYPLVWRALKNSAFLSLGGATLAVILATALVYFVRRVRIPAGALLEGVSALSVSLPGVVLGMGFLMAWIRTPLYATIWILVAAYVVRFLGVGIRVQAAALASISPELEEAGRVAGASRLRTIGSIVMPLLRTGTTSAWLLLFIIFVRELGTSVLLWSPRNEVLSIALLIAAGEKTLPVTAAFSVLQVAVLLVAATLFLRIAGAERIEV